MDRDVKNVLEKAVMSKTRNTAHFTNNITEHKTNETKPIQIIGSGKTRYNPDGAIYIIGFVKYDFEKHGKIQTTLPHVLEKANYTPSLVQEDGSVVEDFNGGQLFPFPFRAAFSKTMFENEVIKAIRRSSASESQSSWKISSMMDVPSKTPKGVLLSKGEFTEQSIKDILQSVEKTCNVKITTSKGRGKPPSDYIKYASISWIYQ